MSANEVSRRTFVQTNADGTFTLTVPPGTYKLVAYHQALPYIPVFHAGQQLFENAILITAPANVTFVLRPGVKVRGTVKEAPIGVPLAGLDVVAYGLAGDLQYRTETNPAGEFAFVLPEGTAFKFAVEDEGGNYRTTFYQDATSFASAATIVANVGAPILQFSIPRAGDAESKTTLFIPGVIHARNDAGGTFFKTDIWIQNPAEESLDVEVAYLPAGQDNSAVTAVPITVPAQGQTALLDIVESVFGASGAGALRLEAAQPFRATSRTYNEPVNADEIGTFGLSIPAQSVSATLSRATLAGLAQNATRRTNIGLMNPQPFEVAVNIDVFSATGSLLGNLPITLKPGEWAQPAVAAFVPIQFDQGYAVVSSGDGSFFSYAAVVDAKSGDGTFILPSAD